MTIIIKAKYRILVEYVKYKIEFYIRPNKTLRTTPLLTTALLSPQHNFQKDEFYLCIIILHKLCPGTKKKKNTETNQLEKLYL